MKGIIDHTGVFDDYYTGAIAVMITVPTNWPFKVRGKDCSYYYCLYNPFMKTCAS